MATTTVTATTLGQVLGPITLSTNEDTVNIALTLDIISFMLLCDGDWLYHSSAAQSDMLPVKANQGLVLQSLSGASFTFYAKVATGTPKLYIVPVSK
jgi:hypothetical protein